MIKTFADKFSRRKQDTWCFGRNFVNGTFGMSGPLAASFMVNQPSSIR